MSLSRVFAVLLLVTVGAVAQPALLSCQIAPNPATPGAVLTYTVEATVAGGLQTGGGITGIRQGSPNGPLVWQSSSPPGLLIPVGPGAPWTGVFQTLANNGTPLAPGTYYAIINWFGQGTALPQGCFPFRLDGAVGFPEPVLSASGNLTGGQTTTLTLSSPPDPGALYICAASMTTCTGWSLPNGAHVALDMNDPIFPLSYPTPLPGVFNGFSGALDGSGQTSAISVFVPFGFVPLGNPGAVQGAVIDSSGNIKLSNALTISIQ